MAHISIRVASKEKWLGHLHWQAFSRPNHFDKEELGSERHTVLSPLLCRTEGIGSLGGVSVFCSWRCHHPSPATAAHRSGKEPLCAEHSVRRESTWKIPHLDAFFIVIRRSKLKPRAGVGSQYFKQSSKTNCIFHFPKHILNKEEV